MRDLSSYRLSKLIIVLLVFTLILGIPKNVGAQFTIEPKINLNGSLITTDDYPMYIDVTGRMMVSSSLVNKIIDEAGIKQEDTGGTSKNTFIPLRSILEKHNFEINWDNESKIAYIDTANASRNINNWEINLWQKTVTPYLKEELWNCRESADAMEVLMIPLHAAFEYDRIDWQNEFAAHFQRFMIEDRYNIINESADNDFAREQYLYLASQFIKLATQENRSNIIPPGLIDKLYEEIDILWYKKPAWMWNRDDFKGGMKERIVWKLNNTNSTPSYYHALFDSELFLFAIAADLKSHENLSNAYKVNSPVLVDILDTAYKVFKTAMVYTTDSNWLFQPGVWSDHPDYLYAGNQFKKSDIKPIPIPGIASDSSHSIRFPLWLTSMSDAYNAGEPNKTYYDELKKGLEKQFYDKVLVKPTADIKGYRTTNYMDGRNGIYRWGYITHDANDGYGPYELSGTLILGWWTFLDSNRIRNLYVDIAQGFPLPPNVINVYVGPNTTRERNSLVSWPNYFTNGFAELDVRLAGKLKENYNSKTTEANM